MLTLEIVWLSIHKYVVDKDNAKDACPEVQIAEYENESNILGWNRKNVSHFRTE